jgi:transmembrane sensor
MLMNREKIWHLFARKLTGEASVEELQELEQYIQQDSSLLYELMMMQQFWEAAPDVDAEYMEATYLLHCQKMEKLGIEPGNRGLSPEEGRVSLTSRSFSRRNLMIAAVFVSCLVLSVYLFVNNNFSGKSPVQQAQMAQNPQAKQAETRNATKIKLQLPDGSTVWMNAGSKLNYEKIEEGNLREVYLTGEAYFDVKRNPKRPFIIHTSTMDLRVLGTEFNVKAYPGDATVEASLIHGSVEVVLKSNPGKKYILKPDEKIVLYKSQRVEKAVAPERIKEVVLPGVAIQKLTYINGAAVSKEAAWTRNMLIFEDEPFEEVARKMERWFDVQFEFKNKYRQQLMLKGSFENETLQQAIEALQFSTRFNFAIDGRKVIIY